jgi:hypothetical protein
MGDKEYLQKKKEQVMQMVKTAGFTGSSVGTFQRPYPSSFLSLSDMKIPKTPTELFNWCKYFYTFDPLITGSINSLSAFPVTEVFLEDRNGKGEKESDKVRLYRKMLFDNIKIYNMLVEIGIDYWLYGNCFIFGEMWNNPNTKEVEWKRVTRLDVTTVTIDVNPITGEKTYKWNLPDSIVQLVKSRGRSSKAEKAQYDALPDIVKQSIRENKSLVLNPERVYHFSRPTDSLGSSVWGTPVGANVIKLLMYRNKLRRAQEALADEHIVPQRVYCIAKSNSYDAMTNFNNVALNLREQLNQTVTDPNYKIISPVPLEVITLGGQGKVLMVTGEIDQVTSEILAGMNVPKEFIYGGVSYSGTSVSLRILENQFITYRLLLEDFIQNFLIKGMAKARGEWRSEVDDNELPDVKMTELKMMDDVQQKQLVIQMNASGKCTDEYMWKQMGWDPDKTKQQLENEALEKIVLQEKLQIQQLESQRRVQDIQMSVQMDQQKQQIAMELELLIYKKELYEKAGIDMNTGLNQNEMAQAQMEQEQAMAQQQGMEQEQAMAQQQQEEAQMGHEQNMEKMKTQQAKSNASAAESKATQAMFSPKKDNKGGNDKKDSPTKALGINVDMVARQIATMDPMKREQALQGLPKEVKAEILGHAQNSGYTSQDSSPQKVQILAEQIAQLPDTDQAKFLATIDPQIKTQVVTLLQQMGDSSPNQNKSGGSDTQTDMRPMPLQKPPRRDSMN